MKRSVHRCAIFLTLFLILEVTNAIAIRERRDANDSSTGGEADSSSSSGSDDDGSFVATLKNILDGVPLIGGQLKDVLQSGVDMWIKTEQLTDGAIGRVLGGAFPCTIYPEKLVCTGVSATSDIADLVKAILDPIPGIMVPGFVKMLIVFLVDISWAPTMDVLFGGVSKKN